MELALTKPRSFPYGPDKSKTGWEFFTIDGEKFTCFDGDLVKAFTEGNLQGQKKDYIVQDGKNGKGPAIIGIRGVYSPQQRQGGWKGGAAAGPMLTDRQVALFAAVGLAVGDPEAGVGETLALASDFLKWLQAGSQQGAGQSPSGSAHPAPDRSDSDSRSRPAPAVPATKDSPDHPLVRLALRNPQWVDRPALADAYLRGQMKKFSVTTLDALTDEAAAVIEGELNALIGLNAERVDDGTG